MNKTRLLFFSTGLGSLLVYISTLAPTITWRNDGADSGDLAAAVAVGGIPHPPGYPTYLVLGDVFKLLPFGDIAYRLNLLSAISAALTVAVIGLLVRQTLLTAHPHQVQAEQSGQTQNLVWYCAATASLTLAFSALFWSQAVIAEVYALNMLFAAVLLYGTLQVKLSNERWLVPGLSGLLGLSLGNHHSILLLFPMLIWIVRVRWRWRLIVAALLVLCVGLLVYLIIPIRAATLPPINWGTANSWPNFLWLVKAEAYRQFFFALPWQFVPIRIVAGLRLLAEAFLWWGLPVGLLGLQRLIRLNRALGYSSLLTFFLISIWSIGYNTTDSYVYFLPALLMCSLWIGRGLYDLGNTLQKFMVSKLRGSHLIGWGLLILPLFSVWLNYTDQNISQDDKAYIYAQQTLQIVEPNAVIITETDPHTFSLWYGRYGLEWRPDVTIVNANLLVYSWYRQYLRQTHSNVLVSDREHQPLMSITSFIDHNIEVSPIYLTSHESLESDNLYYLRPYQHLYQIEPLKRD